ncbi:MAG: glycosyltransferase [Parvularculaceae bacterium]
MPRLSVVMPVYNGERYLAAAVDSILSQSEPDFEFIILDDGSADASGEIIARYAGRDSRIRHIIGGANKGITARLNEGLSLARAPLIARMDHDDISLPQRFERQFALLEAQPQVVLVGSRVVIIDPDGDELIEMGDALTHEDINRGLMSGAGQLVYHPSVMFRREAALAIGGYDESFPSVQDLDFFLKLGERGRIENLAEPLLKYREHFGKMGATHRVAQEREIDRAIAAAHARRGTKADATAARARRKPESPVATFRKWGWWALKGGRVGAARKHALRAFARAPIDRESARLLWCALRGY